MSELEKKERQERDDVYWVMSTEQGRRFIWRLLGECKVFHDFEGDTNQILKSVGRRQIGLFLSGITTDASEDLYFKMMTEAKNQATKGIQNDDTKQPTDADIFEQFHSGHAYDSDSSGGFSGDQYF